MEALRPSRGERTLGTDMRTEGTERRGGGGGGERKNRKMGKAERKITGEGRGEREEETGNESKSGRPLGVREGMDAAGGGRACGSQQKALLWAS